MAKPELIDGPMEGRDLTWFGGPLKAEELSFSLHVMGDDNRLHVYERVSPDNFDYHHVFSFDREKSYGD